MLRAQGRLVALRREKKMATGRHGAISCRARISNELGIKRVRIKVGWHGTYS